MADWSVVPSLSKIQSIGAGILVSAHASANTKGNYTELVASTTFGSSLFVFSFDYTAGNVRDFLLDIALGAAGSEYVIISNIIHSTTGNVNRSGTFYIPISIPAGQRISARMQCSTGSVQMYTAGVLYATDWGQVFPIPLTYGANTADSGGTSIDPGTSAYTKGAYVQLVASTAVYHGGIVIGTGNQLSNARDLQAFWVDVAVGAAGSEVNILQDILISTGYGVMPFPRFHPFMPVRIPSGSRLSVRDSSSSASSSTRLIDVVLYCF